MAPSKYNYSSGAQGYRNGNGYYKSSESHNAGARYSPYQQTARNTDGRQYRLEYDGASKGNPGTAGCGGRIVDCSTEREVVSYSKPLPYGTTSNEAEYRGLNEGLRRARDLGAQDLLVQGDSKLVTEQVNGNWKVKAPNLQPYYKTAVEELSGFSRTTVQNVPREYNRAADKLANQAAQEAGRLGL